MTKANIEFTKIMFRLAKKDLQELIGKKKANELIKYNMDVLGRYGHYFRHWVKDGEIIKEDLYAEGKASCVNEARATAICELIDYIRRKDGDNLEKE